jgi:hypothetical protein
MRNVLGAALVLSLIGNGYLGLRMIKQGDEIEAGVHAEIVSKYALEDLSYFLRHSDLTSVKLLDLARKQPGKAGRDRQAPELRANRFVWFPLEMTFTASGSVDQIRVAGETY